jgi:CheY-like chemotaxis protein
MADKTAQPTVLVVDDEEAIRWMMWRVLRNAGYHVIEVGDAQEALSVIDERRPIDLLITDVHMPDLTGDELARRARLQRPNLRVLYVSGLVDELFGRKTTLGSREAYLEKPFTLAGLNQAVAQSLWNRSVAPAFTVRPERAAPAARRQQLVWAS